MNEKQAIELLRKYASDERSFKAVLAHSKKVQEIALRIAKNVRDVDVDFIKIASLLHDIGSFKCPRTDRIKHGIAGAEILRKEGFERYARVAENHLGVGTTKEDIIKNKLDIPVRNYIPKTKEEKIICWADKLVCGDKEITVKQLIKRFKKELGMEYANRVLMFSKEMKKLES